MLATSQEAAVSLRGVIEESEARFGLLRVSLPGGHVLLVPSASGAVGDQIRVRILAADVSLPGEPPGRSSILNVLPAQIVPTTRTIPTHAGCRSCARSGPAWFPTIGRDVIVLFRRRLESEEGE